LHHLYISPQHPSCAAVCEKLEARLPGLVCCIDPTSMLQCSHMLVLMDTGGTGNAQRDSPALNNKAYRLDILAALNKGLEIIILHVGPSVSDDYMWDKGTALWKAGLFNVIAIPCPELVLGLASEAREDAELEAIALVRVGQKICKSAEERKELHGSHHLLQSGKQLASSVVSKVGLARHASARFGARFKTMASARFGSGAGGLAKGIVVNPLHVRASLPGERAERGWSMFRDGPDEWSVGNPLRNQDGVGGTAAAGAQEAVRSRRESDEVGAGAAEPRERVDSELVRGTTRSRGGSVDV